jgi:hypothetical protein
LRRREGLGDVLTWAGGEAVEWVHVVDLREWRVQPARALSPLGWSLTAGPQSEGGLQLLCTGPPVGLLEHALHTKLDLGHAELLRLCGALALPVATRMLRAELLRELSAYVCTLNGTPEQTEAFLAETLRADGQGSASKLQDLIADPLVEAAYEELGEDDKGEFPELREGFHNRQASTKVRAWRAELGRARESAPRRRRGRGRGAAAGPRVATAPAGRRKRQAVPGGFLRRVTKRRREGPEAAAGAVATAAQAAAVGTAATPVDLPLALGMPGGASGASSSRDGAAPAASAPARPSRGYGKGAQGPAWPVYPVTLDDGTAVGHLKWGERDQILSAHCEWRLRGGADEPCHGLCRLSRTVRPNSKLLQQGRPVGFLVAWLRRAYEYPDREAHFAARQGALISRAERLEARAWAERTPHMAWPLAVERPQRPGEEAEPLCDA